ncbi:MAG: thiamine pyrophosphate-binding protein [Burkholderiaceae bacterium]
MSSKLPGMHERHGGQLVADALCAHGVDTVFGVPGESYLAVLEGMHQRREDSRFIICRQEGGAANMADAYAKLTGKPGVLMVTRGPGATNASIGVHTAYQDSTPMLVLIGQVGTQMMDREAFQEIDYRIMYGPITKWTAQVEQVERIPEYIARGLQVATSGRMGPVALALPEDVLTHLASVRDTNAFAPAQASPGAGQVQAISHALDKAKRPLMILGGSGWTTQACQDIANFAVSNNIPVACSLRRQDLFDNNLPNYIGDVGIGINPKLADRIRNADLLIVLGAKMGEMPSSGYTLLDIPVPQMKMIHVHPGAEELGRVYQAEIMINSGMPEIASALAGMKSTASKQWTDHLTSGRAEYEQWQSRPPVFDALSKQGKSGVDLWAVMQTLQSKLPNDTIVANGAGNFATWAHRFWRYGPMRSQLAPTSGAMGYGVPAAVAASICAPDRTVLCIAGDGDLMMTVQELATARQYGGTPLVIVFNNSMYGTIRMHQERDYPNNIVGTELTNPDFASLAEAFGGFGACVESDDQFAPALDNALKAMAGGQFAMIEIKVDQQIITPGKTMDEIRGSA